MKKIFKLIIFSLMMIFSSNCLAAESPPHEITLQEMVAGEGDVGLYVNYSANTAIKLYAAPRSNNVIGTLQAGDFVTRTSSLTYANPAAYPVKILQTFQAATSPKAEFTTTLYEGDFVYLIMPLAEGNFLGWYNGKHIWWLNQNIKNFLTPNAKNSWGEYQGAATNLYLGVEVWEFLERADGLKGWALTRQNGNSLNNLDRRDKFGDS